MNHFTEPINSESGVKEICASFPDPVGPGLPHHLQEPWAALIDTGAVTSIAPSSFAPHAPVTPHTGQLVNVNGGKNKMKGHKMITYVTHRIVMNITFLIVDHVVSPIIALDALHQHEVQFHLFQSSKAHLQQRGHRAVLHYFKNHYYSSGLVSQGYIKCSILQWEDPERTVFDSQSMNQTHAENDFEVNSESHLSHSVGEEGDSNQEANQAQCLKILETVSAADSLTCLPGPGAQFVREPKVNSTITNQSRRSFNLIIAFTRIMVKLRISKVLTFVETVTSMSGAVTVLACQQIR